MLNIKNLNKGKRKNLMKRLEITTKKSINKKKGSALAETIILIAVSLVLALALFYPEISSLLRSVMDKMNLWINNTMTII